jgi:hypothetical protein
MDEQYQARAARQRRMVILAGTLLALAACVFFAVSNTFYDRCTNSFERGADAVARSYLQALSQGDLDRVQNCWVRTAYFEVGSGCSEVCLSRVLGVPVQVQAVQVGQPALSGDGRARLEAEVQVTCPDGSPASGQLVLDSVTGAVPWKHWRVIESTVGGTAAQPWCR